MKKFITSLKLLASVLLIVFILSCSKDSPTEIGSEILTDAFAQADEIQGIKSLIVLKDGRIIKEKYWHGGGAVKPHDVRSVTKSVVGLLIGIAIDNGFIMSEEDSIGKYLKQVYPDIKEQYTSIKIKHLLTMSGGFSGNELANPPEYNSWITSPSQVNYVLSKAIINQPGLKFAYSSGALHLLSVILSVSTKMSTHAFAKYYLFDPLGIPLNYWETDKQGYNNGGAGLNVSPYDMIKIGYLILNRGEYEGKQIVSKEWIDKTTQLRISTNNAQPYGPSYGYCLWTGQNDKGNYAFANGYGGQFIVVCPGLNLVVTATNEWNNVNSSNANSNWMKTLDLIMKKIVTEFD
mgnify:CR=1 FL=1